MMMATADYINKVICGMAEKKLKFIDNNSIDLTITSPPYDDLRDYEGYKFDFEAIAKELFRVTKEGGVVVWVVNDQTINGSETGTSFRQALYFMEIGFNLHDTMIYEKTNFSNPSRNRYHQIFEYMFIFSKGKPKTFNPILDRKNKYGICWGKNTNRSKNGEIKEIKKRKPRKYGMKINIWRMNTSGQEKPCQSIEHPATFPEKLAKDHISTWSNEGDIILDPMCGAGTTCEMALKNNRKYIGFDISKKYVGISEKRLSKLPNTRLEQFEG